MIPTPPAESAFHLALDVTSNLLTARWSQYVPDVELHSHFADLLTTARMHGRCRFWLLDLRGRYWYGTQIGQWLGVPFAVQASQALGLPVFVACVLDPLFQQVTSNLGTAASQRACAAHDFYPNFFINEAAARAWLRQQQVPGVDYVPRPRQVTQFA